MDENTIPKRILKMKVSGSRLRGRQHTWWIAHVKRNVERSEWHWRRVDDMQEWADTDSWRLLCKSWPVSVEMTLGRRYQEQRIHLSTEEQPLVSSGEKIEL
jgi:hypothetical protein